MAELPLALSLGDPAGIGPEIVVRAWSALCSTGPAFVVVGDAASLSRAAGPDGPPIRAVSSLAEGHAVFATALPVLDLPLTSLPILGSADRAAAPTIIAWIEEGARLALAGEACGLVTAPIAKAPLYEAGFEFPGHTEFLGRLAPTARAGAPVMMLTARDLRCALVTIHEPLERIANLLSVERIVAAGQVTAAALAADFAIARPRIAVAALNPHAGESGALGRQEAMIIGPAVRALAEAGIAASGPYPADSLFHAEARARYDAVLCMYHDQALIPVKMLDFWGAVNVTLGLPIVRTSPDHGVAYEIAGRGLARPDSLIAAATLAGEIAARRAG